MTEKSKRREQLRMLGDIVRGGAKPPVAGSATGSAFEIVAIKFRDIPDVINRRKQSRTFQSRYFKRGDKREEESALKELWESARKYGLTEKEVLKVVRRGVEMPNSELSGGGDRPKGTDAKE